MKKSNLFDQYLFLSLLAIIALGSFAPKVFAVARLQPIPITD